MIDISGVSVAVFAMYLLVASNYVAEMFGCRLRNLLATNMIVKNFVAYFLLLFLVIVVNPEFSSKKPWVIFVLSLIVYVWFLLTSRTHIYVTLVILFLLMVSYICSVFINQYKAQQKEGDNSSANALKIAKIAQTTSTYAAIIITVLGFIFYLVEKKREYGQTFTLGKFFIGNIKCKGYTPKNAKIL